MRPPWTRSPTNGLPPLSLGGWLGALVGAACLLGCAESAPARERPRNLLLVIFDTTRADHLSTYGYPEPTSPTIDALAERGTRFDAAYSQSSLTPVSAGSFLTGTLPPRTGIRSLFSVDAQSLAAGIETLAERLSAAGMKTAAFVSAAPMGSRYGLDRGFERYSDEVGGARKSPCGNEYQRRSDATTDRALEWLGSNGLDTFALMVHFFDAHDANLAPPRDFLAERVSFPLPRDVETPCALMGLGERQKVELYDAEIAFMDAQLDRLLQRLDRMGVLDETLVCLIADHGEGLGQHGNWTHGWLYHEQLRVPLVLAGPGIPEGRAVESAVRLIDLFPTFADLFGVRREREDVAGISLLPLLDGATESPRPLYAEVHHDLEDFLGRDPAMFALERDGWKLIHRPETGKHELYHVAVDPEERENLFAPDHPQAVRLLAGIEALGGLEGGLETSEHLSDEMREELRKLGYLGDSDPEPPADGE